MKNVFLLILTTACFNICLGQNEPLFKKNPHRLIIHPEVPKPSLPQNQLYRDLTEQVDSAWTRQFGGVGIGNVTSSKAYFTYTSAHLLATESYLDFFLETGEQYNGRQEEYFYNGQGLCTLHYTNKQDLDSGDWFRKDREEVTWNEDSLTVEYRTSKWNNDLSWFDYISKSVWSYTSSNQTEEIFLYSWDIDHWKTEARHNYEYNDSDSLQVINIYNWDEVTEEWQLEYKEEYFYTNDIDLDSIIDYWDMGLGLEPYSRDILTFNGQGLLESDIYYEWSGSHWEPSSIEEYEYTPEGKETLSTYFEWNKNEQRFVEDFYEENLFTPAGDPMRKTYADYDSDAEAWEPWWITENFYDENVDGSTIVWPNPAFYAPVSFHHKPVVDVSTILFDPGGWGFADSVIYFYGNIISATIPVSKLNVNVYPNPSSDQITVQMEQLRPGATIAFYDQQGKEVTSRPLQSNLPVSISGLLPGAYVFRIRNGTEFYGGKFLKE
jgi:hypothetical protein